MKQLTLLIFFLMFSCNSYAGCSETLNAKTTTQSIEIGDNACAQSEVMIFVRKIDKHGVLGKESKVSFSSECSWIAEGFSCKATGSTILAGTRYKKVPGDTAMCGNPNWPKYQCVAGCKRLGVPPILTIDPYEC